MSKLYLICFINYFVKWSLHAQNAVWTRVPHPIFAAALCNNREYLRGESVSKQLSQQFTCPYKEWSSPIGPQLWGKVFSPGGRGPKSPILSGRIGPDAERCAIPKLPHWKGLSHFFVYFYCAKASKYSMNSLSGFFQHKLKRLSVMHPTCILHYCCPKI